jgi:hypothetical protein
MNVPEFTHEYSDVELYVPRRLLTEESSRVIQAGLDEVPEDLGEGLADYHFFGNLGAAALSSMEVKTLFTRTLTGEPPYKQSVADDYNKLVLEAAETNGQQNPRLETVVNEIEVYGGTPKGARKGSYFVAAKLEGEGSDVMHQERFIMLKLLQRFGAFHQNYDVRQYQPGWKKKIWLPHLSFAVVDTEPAANVLKEALTDALMPTDPAEGFDLAFGKPELDTIPFFTSGREYKQYLARKRSERRQAAATSPSLAEQPTT